MLPVLRAAVTTLANDPLTIIKRMQLALEHLPQAELAQFTCSASQGNLRLPRERAQLCRRDVANGSQRAILQMS